jgi:hypothetical protein
MYFGNIFLRTNRAETYRLTRDGNDIPPLPKRFVVDSDVHLYSIQPRCQEDELLSDGF